MQTTYIDAKTGLTVKDDGAGNRGGFSWRRLEEILRAAGELRPHETVTRYRVNFDGVAFYVEDQPELTVGQMRTRMINQSP
jgi:hypothetical protein